MILYKIIPKKKKHKKAERLSQKALQITEKRREAKGKGKKGRYTHLNAENSMGVLKSLYKELRKEEKLKAKEKRKAIPI